MSQESDKGNKDKYTAHVVSHTHWDREWYLTFQQFRVRLVDLIDNLLDLLNEKPDYEFTLDGQTAVLDDYLEIKPSKREELKQYIEAGNVKIGPWYILPDEFLVSGESIVRNLLKGSRESKEFGEPMDIGYVPDMFGHISQLPAIMADFGIENAFLWRGVGERIDESQFIWEGDDGSRLLTTFLYEGYCNLASVPEDKEGAEKLIREVLNEEKGRATTDQIILMNGCDHLEAQPQIPEIIDEVDENIAAVELIHSNLPNFLEALKGSLQKGDSKLKEVKGELRRSTDRGEIFPGTLSSRTYLKARNAKMENLLEKWVEPFSTLSFLMGARDRKDLLNKAWEYLLQNQPHDSICGCSIDEVHEQMLTRYDWSEEICQELLDRSLDYLVKRIDKKELTNPDQLLVVFNPEDRPYSGTVRAKLELNTPFEGIMRKEWGFESGADDEVRDFEIKDAQGNVLPYQVLDERTEIGMELDPQRLTKRKDKETFEIAFPVQEVPPVGFKAYDLSFTEKDEKNIYKHAEETPLPTDMSAVRVDQTRHSMENGFLKATIDDEGQLNIFDKRTGKEYRGCNKIEDRGDAGDEYNYSRPRIDRAIHSGVHTLSDVELLQSGPVLASYRIEHEMDVPKGLSSDRKKRSAEKEVCRIASTVSLGIGEPYLKIRTKIENRAKDHRIRALFPFGEEVEFSHAEGSFTVNRRPVESEYEDSKIESETTTYPQKSFVDVNDGDSGLAVFNEGLREYEVIGESTIALTLLRSVGWLANDDFLSRNSSIGTWRKQPTPGAQCIGDYEFSYAVMPHEGSWKEAGVHKRAHEFRSERRVKQKRTEEVKESGRLSARFSFLQLKPSSLNLSAIKKAEDGDDLILRVYNVSEEEVSGEINIDLDLKMKKVFLSNMAEEKLREVKVKGGKLEETFAPHQIRTWRIDYE